MPTMIKLKCDYCGKEFERQKKKAYRKDRKGDKQFCESKCWYAYLRNSTKKTTNICPICGKKEEASKAFWDSKGGHSCCSKKCAWVKERRRKMVICPQCGKRREGPQSKIFGKLCADCHLDNKRNKVTLECPICGVTFERGKAAYERTQTSFCSNKCARKHRRGENSPLWKGGVSSELRRLRGSSVFKKWRQGVFERDDYTCQGCGTQGGYLHPHHIKGFADYPELRFDLSNGVTLCIKCHGDVHGLKYSQRRTTKNDVQKTASSC